jgi:putative endonuclease
MFIPANAGTQAHLATPKKAQKPPGGAVSFYTYIMASGPYGTLYTGMTHSLYKRVHEHREALRPGFTAKYGVKTLVWFERHEVSDLAFRRERQIKEWKRRWKIEMIETMNPGWRDLADELEALLEP